MSFLNRLYNRKKDRTLKDLAESEKPAGIEPDKEEAESNLKSNALAEGTSDKPSEEEYEVVEREILPAKIICPDCGGVTLEGLDFCDKCGGEL